MKELISHRIIRSEEAWKDSEILIKEKRWNAAASRIYYSCFYCITAYLISININASTHTGVKSMFNKHLINTKILNKDLGVVYNYFYNLRQDADYQDFFKLDNTDIFPYLDKSKELISEIKKLLN